jgi:hypothetical protein
MIVPSVESTINGVQCYFTDKNVEAYHIVYDDAGHLDVLRHGKIQVGTKKSLFSATTTEELKAEINAQGLFVDDASIIDQELKEILFNV